ncbi:tripartite tricarboxylate transporter TctB family protein [Halorussus amylolyticus]|uniref:tripartite tricarboxylate transporter TctB family protein n=1 Tax=Halorussus amylolyticus TaxID=1126242 RepID=UPI001043849C|nr:tripartite tricarboxylate transporter TctB family protein [Halorussus amylolyticus]
MTIEIRHTDKVGAALLVALAAGVFVASRDFPSGFGGSPGAAFFPRVVAATIGTLAVVLFVRSVASRDPRTHRISTDDAVRFAVPVALLAAYVAAMSVLGFVLATVAFLVGLMRYSGVERYARSIPLALGVAIALHYVFREFLHVPLPSGSVPVSELLPALPLLVGVA